MRLITAYYHITCDILKNYIPYKPGLKLTNAKGYMGQINIKARIVSISKWHHVDSEYLMDEEDRNDIIDTICHELAHIHFQEHDEDHKQLTEQYKTVVLNQLKIRALENVIREIA